MIFLGAFNNVLKIDIPAMRMYDKLLQDHTSCHRKLIECYSMTYKILIGYYKIIQAATGS